MNQVAIREPDIAAPKRGEAIAVLDPVPVLDTARFEHMQRIATVMARTNLIPETLCMEGKGDNKQPLPFETIMANCFLIVNQAVRWGMDPFAVAQCTSVVHGKLCYEGKLVAAVLEAKLGIRLRYTWSGQPNDSMGIVVAGRYPGDDDDLLIEGTVGEWKTTGNNSPWSPKNYRRMLAYRGAREWARLYAPGVLLGVYSDDEMEDMGRMSRLTEVQVARLSEVQVPRIAPPPPPPPPPPAAAAKPIEVPLAGRARKPADSKPKPAKLKPADEAMPNFLDRTKDVPPPKQPDLQPLDDYPKAISDWIEQFGIADTLADLDEFMESEVRPYLDGGLVEAADAERVEHAYGKAKAAL